MPGLLELERRSTRQVALQDHSVVAVGAFGSRGRGSCAVLIRNENRIHRSISAASRRRGMSGADIRQMDGTVTARVVAFCDLMKG